MPSIDINLAAVLQPLDSGAYLEEALLFPEICCLGDDPARLHRALKNLVTRYVLDIPRKTKFTRHLRAYSAARVVDRIRHGHGLNGSIGT
jgi:hypothetical protein